MWNKLKQFSKRYSSKDFVVIYTILSVSLFVSYIITYYESELTIIDKGLLSVYCMSVLSFFMWGFFIQANISDKIIKKYEKNLDDYEKLNKDIISSSVQYMNSHQVILKIYKMLANSNVTQEDKKEYVFEVVKKALENYLDENQNQIQKFIEDTEEKNNG